MKTAPVDVIQSPRNPVIQEFRRAFSESNFRKNPYFPVEGPQLVAEALDFGLSLDAVLVSSDIESSLAGKRLVARLRAGCRRFSTTSEKLVQAASGTQHSQGVLCLFRKPEPGDFCLLLKKPQLVLVLVDVQDPGNCGALARSLLAFGGHCIVTVGATSDLLGPKAVRASAGASFRLAARHYRSVDAFLDAPELRGIPLLGTVPAGGLPSTACHVEPPAAVLVGNESRGLPQGLLKRCHERLSLPMFGGMQSLNAAVAGSLVLYDLTRQMGLGPFGNQDEGH